MKKTKKLQAADLFCGAGGFTTGAEASGRVDVCLAINHWRTAIYTHQANHPATRHICARIDDIDPRHDRTIPELDLLMASPECTHHSIARGGRPIDDQKRATPWHVCVWAEAKRPKWLLIENVREFRDWGPLDGNCRPIKSEKGKIFRQWIKALEAIGYQIDCQILNAADFGAATKRLRLFIIGRLGRSMKDIPWPDPTHAGNWIPAWQIINWSKPCPSIFGRKRPLAEKTLKRIEIGLRKFVGAATEPFILTLRKNQNGESIHDPITMVTTGAGHHGLVQPFLVNYHGGVDPYRDGTERQRSVDQPIPVIPTENRYGLCVPFMQTLSHGGRERSLIEPFPTITTSKRGEHSIVVPFMLPRTGIYDSKESLKRSRGVEEPIPTIIASHSPGHVVMPFLADVNHGESGGNRTYPINEAIPTLTTKNGKSLVLPFLTKYYGTGGAVPIDDSLPTVTTKDRCGLAMVSLIQTMQELGVVDIGFRMLDVDELARAQGFPENYVLHGTKSEQVRQVGNAVCPPVAKAICETLAEVI